MALNFDNIPNEVEIQLKQPYKSRTVLEEINARKYLVEERHFKCKDIAPLYEKPKKRLPRYTYKYFCVCPRYNPQYCCRHAGNVIIDRDVLTQEEHLVYLSTPKANHAAPRKMPHFYQKRTIVPNCTARINKLAAPDIARVRENLDKFKHLLQHRNVYSLQQHLEEKPAIEYTDITTALAWLDEERRLKRVSRKQERKRCRKMSAKIAHKQKTQIKKIICVLFEEMKDFLLNDQFIMDERSPLVAVILETIREFTDKEFYTTSNLREYQKILAFNLAVWINKFISNLNIHVAALPPKAEQQNRLPYAGGTSQQLQQFLPVGDYISCSSLSEGYCENDEYPSIQNVETALPSEEYEMEYEQKSLDMLRLTSSNQ